MFANTTIYSAWIKRKNGCLVGIDIEDTNSHHFEHPGFSFPTHQAYQLTLFVLTFFIHLPSLVKIYGNLDESDKMTEECKQALGRSLKDHKSLKNLYLVS